MGQCELQGCSAKSRDGVRQNSELNLDSLIQLDISLYKYFEYWEKVCPPLCNIYKGENKKDWYDNDLTENKKALRKTEVTKT